MVNQNPEPIILSESVEIQAGTATEDIELTTNLASPEVMNIFAISCYIHPGYLDIGEDADYPQGRRTWTDIDPLYIPVLNNAARPDDSGDPTPLYVTLPLCCNPRAWKDISLSLLVGNNPVPSDVINLATVASKLDKTLPLTTPVKVKWSQRLYLKLQNNNPITAAWNTFSKVDILLNAEIINYEQLRKEEAIAKRQQRQR